MYKSNIFSEDIAECADGEIILNIVIGEMGWGDYNSDIVPNYDQIPKGKLLSWQEAKSYLDFNYDSGFGAPECMSIYAWTRSFVIAVCQYVGATWLYKIPRNPTEIMPKMVGG